MDVVLYGGWTARPLHARTCTQSARSFACKSGLSVDELGQVEGTVYLCAETYERDRSALSLWQTSMEHRDGSMPIALPHMPVHSIGPRDMNMHRRCMLHVSSKRSGMRTVFTVVDMLMQKLRAKRSQQPPRSGRRSGESTNSWPTRLQHCALLA